MRTKFYFVLLMLVSFPTWLLAQTPVSGRIVFEGTAPPPEQVEVKSDITTCGNSKEVKKLVLGEGGGVVDAVITIIGTQGTVIPKDGVLDQKSCEFVPHVQVLPVGSKLKITSSDSVLHNSHGFNEDGSTAFNIAVPIAGMELPTTIKQPGVVKLRCDAGHTWMSAYVVGVDHPYYAVTDENGNFAIENVPPGNYEIEVWHEWIGTHREPVIVKEGSEPITITLKKS